MPAESLPLGAYDVTLDGSTARALDHLPDGWQAELRSCPADDVVPRLIDVLRRELANHLDAVADGEDGATRAVDLINGLIAGLRAEAAIPRPLRVLDSIHRDQAPPVLPSTGLMEPWLFTAGRGEPALLSELRRELGTADCADVLVSFITRSGVRRLLDILNEATAVGPDGKSRLRLRVLTTTYTGATDAEAVAQLARLPGAEVRVSLDGSRTRLHAKAWVLHRNSGSGSAYIGSANLSAAALMGGIEWTVKVPQRTQSDLFARAAAEFECLWQDPEFQRFDANDPAHLSALQAALRRERHDPGATGEDTNVLAFDWVPRPFQRLMLERLQNERRHGRCRNLVVAATGTGKTVVAALDYRRSCEQVGSPPTLLFIAHRLEILQRALATFRSVLRPLGISGFGSLLGGGHEPDRLDHLFATIDSVIARNLLAQPERWHTVIIDECHRMGRGTRFEQVVSTLKPHILLGLTATPERCDGHSIMPLFDARPDGGPAVELRLWDALDQQLVVPFEYHGCDDDLDLSRVEWGRPGEAAQIESIIMAAPEVRARAIIAAWQAKVGNPRRSRTIAFCVSVAHAQYMAEAFTRAGIPAACVHGETPAAERTAAPELLARGEVAVLTTVNLYNEGIDIPSIDTLLFLRPTQSPVVFLQQLGRGLRHHEAGGQHKESCLVLDFVGRHREEFRFDRLLGPITGLNRRELLDAVDRGFDRLPPGCHIHLESQTREQVLRSLRNVLQQGWRRLQAELRAYASLSESREISLAGFLADQALDLADVYPDRKGGSGWTALRRACQLPTPAVGPEDDDLGRRLGWLLHTDDPAQIACCRRVAEEGSAYQPSNETETRRLRMLAYQMMDKAGVGGGPAFLARLEGSPAIRHELGELATLLDGRSDLEARPLPGFPEIPLCLHACYGRREILAAFGLQGDGQARLSNAGVERIRSERVEVFFVTLDKTEGFHGRIAYLDCALAPDRFQWQTQSGTTPASEVGLRYLEAPGNGWRFLLFVQERKHQPFRAMGPLTRCLEHQGSKPMTLIWQMAEQIPQALFQRWSPAR
jgi:superfamily II DNA or RNA helicase/HKD family nuclease